MKVNEIEDIVRILDRHLSQSVVNFMASLQAMSSEASRSAEQLLKAYQVAAEDTGSSGACKQCSYERRQAAEERRLAHDREILLIGELSREKSSIHRSEDPNLEAKRVEQRLRDDKQAEELRRERQEQRIQDSKHAEELRREWETWRVICDKRTEEYFQQEAKRMEKRHLDDQEFLAERRKADERYRAERREDDARYRAERREDDERYSEKRQKDEETYTAMRRAEDDARYRAKLKEQDDALQHSLRSALAAREAAEIALKTEIDGLKTNNIVQMRRAKKLLERVRLLEAERGGKPHLPQQDTSSEADC